MEEIFNDHDWQILLDDALLLDGSKKCIARAKRPDSAHVIAITDSGNIVLIKEYRPFYKEHIWMIPSGRVDQEDDPKQAALRELQEESGYRADSLEYYCQTNYSESVVSTNYIYIGKDLVKDPLPMDTEEAIEVFECSLEQAIENVLQSPVVHTASAYALLRYKREHS